MLRDNLIYYGSILQTVEIISLILSYLEDL